MKIRKQYGAPMSAAAMLGTLSIGSHFIERALKTDDEWAATAYWTLGAMLGIISVVEMLQVWQALGLAEER